MNITKLSGLSTNRLEALATEGIRTERDLMNFFPRRYLDRSNVQKIKHLMGSGEEVTVVGTHPFVNKIFGFINLDYLLLMSSIVSE